MSAVKEVISKMDCDGNQQIDYIEFLAATLDAVGAVSTNLMASAFKVSLLFYFGNKLLDIEILSSYDTFEISSRYYL